MNGIRAAIIGCCTTAMLPVVPTASARTSAAQHDTDQLERTADARAAEALREMTVEERRGLLHGPMPMLVPKAKRPEDMVIGAGYIAGVPRLGIPSLRETDASLGVANLMNQRPGDTATALPAGLAIASTWDSALAQQAGALIGSEARGKGFNVMLAGGVNLTRDPRNGRNFEYFGEDPLLTGVLGGHMIEGVQSAGIVSTMKHFAVNNQETGRNVLSANIGESAMRESDLLAFQFALEIGNPGSVMCSYNRINGEFACENDFLLNHVLRDDWGFKGWVMSDWGAVHSTEAIMKGLDQQSGEQIDGKPYFSTMLDQAIAEGRVPESAADKAAHRVLRTMFARGLVDDPVDPKGSPIDYDTHAQLAQKVAEAGIVLLKNDGDLLPVASSAHRILVVGGHADVGVISGGGSSQVRPVGGPALELKGPERNGHVSLTNTIIYVPSSPLEALRAALPDAKIDFVDGSDLPATVDAARQADLVIVFGERWDSESVDATDLSLGAEKNALIESVAGANQRTVVVLETGNPVTMPWLDKVPAVLEAWYPGQRGGEAIAAVLTGTVNPSGHLPITFPASAEQLPNPVLPGSDAPPPSSDEKAVYGILASTAPFDVTYPEGADVGYRWFDRTEAAPLFAFGHGLSYTRFEYHNLEVSGGDTLTVSFDVRNVGDREGADVPQVYARGTGTKRLIGWERVTLAPGETRRVTVTADPRLLASFDSEGHRWKVASGRYAVEVGMSAITPVLNGAAKLKARSLKP
ncbi:glycoside hydrolase family 3 C-terminal domain-containing protein [Novosphingobium pentaromativorans]|uniref:Glycoside hydrolase family 3 domain protein n=1 Tax=Novosphingobium pentaromativorans US6-1 TaxID=1088721 RepID=G6E740_9SPHN|nr:glycoside hydrolase family 3 C-terminal domain-containing protein [Novosphingobium pentaromativorans]AIT81763.1 beta-glucosidase [Novosphingobium pentaromativorans US6-1]EHJ62867.1 glycoside hydrolase family 3 domain protein [Novosphingobium pentaromativorans US6-1]